MEKEKNFDKRSIYDNSIEPIINELKQVCVANDIPFCVSFAVANNEKKTVYKNDGYLASSIGMKLTDDRFKKILLVCCNADVKVIPKGTNFEIDANDIDDLQSVLDDSDMDFNDEVFDEDENFDDLERLANVAINTKPEPEVKTEMPENTDTDSLSDIFVGDL